MPVSEDATIRHISEFVKPDYKTVYGDQIDLALAFEMGGEIPVSVSFVTICDKDKLAVRVDVDLFEINELIHALTTMREVVNKNKRQHEG